MALGPFSRDLVPVHVTPHRGHAHFWQRALSRRQFIGGALGSAAAIAGTGILDPLIVAAGTKRVVPKPIPSGIQPGGPGTPVFHVQFPGFGVENSTITDFQGLVGATDVQGTGAGTNLVTGQKSQLLFDTDMRFMKGTFLGTDGHVHHGTFGFVWLDLYEVKFDFVNFSTQVHDFDPGIDPYPDGLFWTVQVASSAVTDVDVEDGEARYAVHNMHLTDFFNIPNALFHFQVPVSTPATASFDIRWSGPVTQRKSIRDTTFGFAGDFTSCSATMTWSAKSSTFKFVSDPADTSHSVLAVLGHERNGVFFSEDDERASD